jgi:hypothetical protein
VTSLLVTKPKWDRKQHKEKNVAKKLNSEELCELFNEHGVTPVVNKGKVNGEGLAYNENGDGWEPN